MQHLLYLEILGCVADDGFSFDELAVKTKELFEREGMAGFMGLILSLLDENLSLDIALGRDGWRPAPCCSDPRYESQGRRQRSFRTSVGKVKINWRRLRCRHCGRSTVPLREFLGLAPYQSKSSELERTVVEVVSEQSYRRSSNHLRLIGEIPVPKSTLHRWVVNTDCDELDWPADVKFLMADGTGYKRRPDPEAGLSNRGEVRVAIGFDANGQAIPLGAWSGTSWEEIGKRLGALRTDPDQKAGLLISDGETKLAEGLAFLVNGHQRCQWHAVRELKYALWKDKATWDEKMQHQWKLSGIVGVELPSGSVSMVKDEEKQDINSEIKSAEKKLQKMANNFIDKGYINAAKYVNSAKDRLFSHLRFWLKYGLLPPRTSSRIERMMREIGRRLKRIAFGWSESGAAKMTRIIIKRITSPFEWEKYWREKLKIEGRVTLVFRRAYAK